jgi:hypothetical protein
MCRICVVFGLAIVTVVCTAFARGGGQATAFRLPDASAACRLDGPRLVCANLGVRSGLALPARGTPRAVPARVWWDASTPVLHRWSRDAVTCRVVGAAIVCHNGSGAAITVSGAHIAVAL